MRLRSLLLALALCTGLTAAAPKHAKPPKVGQHVKGPKGVKHAGSAVKPVRHRGQKAAMHPSGPKAPRHKAAKVVKHNA